MPLGDRQRHPDAGGPGYFAASDAKGFVGNNFLEKLGRVTLDFGNRRLLVGP